MAAEIGVLGVRCAAEVDTAAIGVDVKFDVVNQVKESAGEFGVQVVGLGGDDFRPRLVLDHRARRGWHRECCRADRSGRCGAAATTIGCKSSSIARDSQRAGRSPDPN